MGWPRSIAIIGAGPSGSALAAFLAKEGRDVVLFVHGKRPPIIVGESLVPAVVLSLTGCSRSARSTNTSATLRP